MDGREARGNLDPSAHLGGSRRRHGPGQAASFLGESEVRRVLSDFHMQVLAAMMDDDAFRVSHPAASRICELNVFQGMACHAVASIEDLAPSLMILSSSSYITSHRAFLSLTVPQQATTPIHLDNFFRYVFLRIVTCQCSCTFRHRPPPAFGARRIPQRIARPDYYVTRTALVL